MLSAWVLLLLAFGSVAANHGSTTSATGTTSAATAIVKTYENDTVLLPCHVQDLGLETRVRWWHGGVLLADSGEPATSATSPRVKMWDNRSLELVQVRPEDSGEYVCQASRPEPWGYVTQVHEIQVMYPARVKPSPETGQLEVTMGEEASMSCLTEGMPKPVLSWSFEGQELPVLASGQKLRIHATNWSLAGVYTCEAGNGIGEAARANIELKIKHKPEVSPVTRWLHVAPGIRAQLECLVVAWPEARVDWYFEGEKLGRSDRALRYREEKPSFGRTAQLHSLVLRTTQVHDLGLYTCEARNELGSANASLELSGLPKPPLLKKDARTGSGNGYNFIWEVDSYSPIVEYQFWFRQMDTREEWRRLVIPSVNEPDGPLHARSFNLTGLQASKQYEALVLARNRFGWSSPSKIVRFATLSAPTKKKETYKIVSVGLEKIPPAVQVTSDSHRSSTEVSSSGRLSSDFLALLLLLLLPLFAFASGEFIGGPRYVS